MAYINPIQSNAGLDLYVKPKEGHTYILTADVSRGTSNDYSAFVVVDVSQMPYQIVAKYRDNEIKPLGWTLKYGKGKVSNIALGHSSPSQSHPMFQKLITNSIEHVSP